MRLFIYLLIFFFIFELISLLVFILYPLLQSPYRVTASHLSSRQLPCFLFTLRPRKAFNIIRFALCASVNVCLLLLLLLLVYRVVVVVAPCEGCCCCSSCCCFRWCCCCCCCLHPSAIRVLLNAQK